MSPYFRLSYATSMERLQTGCDRLAAFCAELPLSCSAQIVRAERSEMPARCLTGRHIFYPAGGRRVHFMPDGKGKSF